MTQTSVAAIQAAFAAQGATSAQAAPAAAVAAQPPPFTPSPFGNTFPVGANPATPAPTPAPVSLAAFPPSPFGPGVPHGGGMGAHPSNAPAPVLQPPTLGQQTFQFVPPAGFNPAATPPINPSGERSPFVPEVTANAAGEPTGIAEAPAAAEPKRRGRKPKAPTPASNDAPVTIGTTQAGAPVVSQTLVEAPYAEGNSLADAIELVRNLLPAGTKLTVVSARRAS